MDDSTLFIYAHGMPMREIVIRFEGLYRASFAVAQASKATDAVIEIIAEWQSCLLSQVVDNYFYYSTPAFLCVLKFLQRGD